MLGIFLRQLLHQNFLVFHLRRTKKINTSLINFLPTNIKASPYDTGFFFMIPLGGGEVREVILISGQNQNCPFLKTDSLADTFFWTKNFLKNVKCYGEKVLEIFLTLKKHFFLGHFFWKKVKKNFEKLFALKKFSKFFLNFFSKKVSWKKNFFECQKNFQNFFPITFYIFFKIFGPKKSVR